MTFPTEKELIERLKKGDESAVRQWYQGSVSKLLVFFHSKVQVSSDAEELVQDTFLSCLASLPLFRGTSGLYGFMLGIARHELADYWRKKYAKKAISALPFGEEILLSLASDHSPSHGDVHMILSSLPIEISEVLLLKYVDGYSVKQLADQFGISSVAMQSRLYRAKEAFVAELSKQG
ncbi:RNA polymerase sigma factor [Candidatus Woesebacteria bacterium]|nr:RNA polymerase sigma factor [Candidatus Woesebacteria bacterium]